MARDVRKCEFCTLPLDRMCRSNQLFCDERCRQRERRRRVKQQEQTAQKAASSRRPAPPRRAQTPPSEQAPPAQPPPTLATNPAAPAPSTLPTGPAPTSRSPWWQEGLKRFASLEEEMRKMPAAVSYRLARAIKYHLKPTFVPERGKPLVRLDGRVSDEPYRLRPEFEPPLVSEAGLFAVQLLDASGRDVGLPRSLHRGVTLPKWPPDGAAEPLERAEARSPAAASAATESQN